MYAVASLKGGVLELQEFIKSHGFDFLPTQLDGLPHEFSDPLGNKGWYIGSTLASGKITCTFGEWRHGKSYSYFSSGTISEGEKHEFEQKQKQFIEQKNERQLQAKKLCSDIFTRYEQKGSDGNSLYLARKKLPPRIPGTIVKPSDSGHAVVVPMRDENSEIWNFQTIFDSGDKSFFNFGRVEGLFFELAQTPGGEPITLIAEGFATGMALHLATGARVIVAFTLSNLKHVAPKFPGAVLCLDNDASTKQKMLEAGHRAPVNPGLEQGAQIAIDNKMGAVCPPGDVSVDYCDLWVSGGPDAVKSGMVPVNLDEFRKFDSAATQPPAKGPMLHAIVGKWVNGLEPMEIKFSKGGKAILPEEVEVARKLFDYYEGSLVRFESDFFIWSGKHWRIFDENDEARVMQQIMVLHSGLGTHTRFRSIYKIFQTMLPYTKRNMFYVNPQRITFNNGTLAIDLVKGNWEFSFREHRRDDFSTNLIPYDYDPEAKNPVFEETISNILGDDEYETKLRAVKQMFGSVLAPLYPRLFLLVGKPGSGKSTLITLATALVSDGNVCSVQPSDFEGFHMEPMAGKLVNAVTDLNVVKPIADAIIKQIEDRIPIAINRKHKSIIRAPFPAVHIFGANDIPPTLERGSMSHTRRWTFIPCDFFQRDVSEHDKERVTRIREAGMSGVINFALEGLRDLLAHKGHFFVPDSGKVRMQKWQTENDPIASFFEAIKQGELPDLTLEAEARCYTKVLWEAFGAWHEDAYNARPRIPKMKFFSRVESTTGPRRTYQGTQVFLGIASKKSPVQYDKDKKGGKEIHQGSLESGNPPLNAGHKLLDNSNDFY